MASAVVDDWEQLADSEPEWDSDDFVPPPVGNASVTPAPVAAPITAAAAPAAAPTTAAASAPEELVYSTVLDEDDMATLETFGDRAAFTPRDIRQYIADHYNPPQPRGGGRNHKYVNPNSNLHLRPLGPKKNSRARSRLFDECREVLSQHVLYRSLYREPKKQMQMCMRFDGLCSARWDISQLEASKEALSFRCKDYLDEFIAPYAQRGSLLQGKWY
jgi:hypothetical protein